MDAADGRIAALSAEIAETIRRIYRSTYIVATLKRDELLHEGRGEEVDRTVESARESQAALIEEASGTSK